MNNESKTIELINSYFDGELEKNKEPILFSLLSDNQKARDYFKQLSVLRNEINNSQEEFPSELEERIFRTIQKKKSSSEYIRKFNFINTLSYAITFLLIILNIYLFIKTSTYQEKIESLSKEIRIQAKTIEMIYNSLPAVEIKSAIENSITIKPTL
ncbi:MAG: hypothetical protein HZC46_11465 [Ignavibacterium album]|uniref:hypothetical protein n=1 Tax=Ignavibacterium album TaxID=591197 RepID=UPI0026F11074|nr:hypothetical protein [Ignavibacterium album]MBI5662755.1 hypothetical protein [Ignavibacterium album]